MSVTQNSEYRGVNRITRDDFRALLKANAAPAVLTERDAGEYWDAIQKYNADALFIAAIFMHESEMGKKGTATQTHSWGNTRTPNFGAQSVGTVKGRSGTFPVFANWLDGCISTVARLTGPTWVYAKGDRTIGEVFTVEPSWAPAGDMNDPEGYLRAVLDFMNAHESETGDTATVAQTDDSAATWQPSPNFDEGGNACNLIILHTTEGAYDGSLGWLRNPQAQASAQYIVSADGKRIAQMVREADVAWGCGNLAYNRRAIQIEQEGFEAKGGFSDGLYATVGGLVGRIAKRHSIPLDRAHVIGHDEVPDPNNPSLTGGVDHHTDPGPHYDFNRVIAIAKGQAPAQPAAQTDTRFFPETRHYLSHGFLRFWEENGGLAIFGLPLSEEFTGPEGYTIQWLERARFEYQPTIAGNQWGVTLGRLGADAMANDRDKFPAAFADAEPPK